jgi:hypothetical protein
MQEHVSETLKGAVARGRGGVDPWKRYTKVDASIVSGGGPGNGVQGFARRIGNQMHMKILACRFVHR